MNESESILLRDPYIDRLAHAVRYGDMSLEAAIRAYSEWQYQVAETYRKLAVEAVSTQRVVYMAPFPCAPCAECARRKKLSA